MMKILLNFVTILIVVVFTAIICLSQGTESFRIEPLNSDVIPVSIESTDTYKNHKGNQSFYTTEFSLTNKSDTYIETISLIGYELNKQNEELATRVWSEVVQLHSFETKHFSTNSGSVSSESDKIVWVVHTICSERGTLSLDLSDLRKMIFPYQSGKSFDFPKAEFYERKCLPD